MDRSVEHIDVNRHSAGDDRHHRDSPTYEESDRRTVSQILIDSLEEFQHPIEVQSLPFGHAGYRIFQKPWTRWSMM